MRRLWVQQPEHLRPEATMRPARQASWHQRGVRLSGENADAAAGTLVGATKRQRKDRGEQRLTPAEETLSKWAAAARVKLESFGWEALVRSARGVSQLSDGVKGLPHKAGRLLDHLRKRGAAVSMRTAPWMRAQVRHAAQRSSCAKSWWIFAAKDTGQSCR